MLTAETITDEQIRELRNVLAPVATPRPRAERTSEDLAIIDACDVALYDVHSVGAADRRAKARARCAELINARAAASLINVKACS